MGETKPQVRRGETPQRRKKKTARKTGYSPAAETESREMKSKETRSSCSPAKEMLKIISKLGPAAAFRSSLLSSWHRQMLLQHPETALRLFVPHPYFLPLQTSFVDTVFWRIYAQNIAMMKFLFKKISITSDKFDEIIFNLYHLYPMKNKIVTELRCTHSSKVPLE